MFKTIFAIYNRISFEKNYNKVIHNMSSSEAKSIFSPGPDFQAKNAGITFAGAAC